LFALLGSARIIAARKNVGEIDPTKDFKAAKIPVSIHPWRAIALPMLRTTALK